MVKAFEPLEFLVGYGRVAAAQMQPLVLDVAGELPGRSLLDEDLDAGLPLVVAASETVVGAQDRVEIVEDLGTRQKLADDVANDRRAAHAATGDDAKAELTGVAPDEDEPHVVQQHGRAVVGRTGDGDLELARQVGELRMERRPLPDELAVRARVDGLVVRDTGEMVAGDVAHVVAGRLDRVHLDRRELGEDVGHVFESRPVELQVLARAEMTVAAVVAAAYVRELRSCRVESNQGIEMRNIGACRWM